MRLPATFTIGAHGTLAPPTVAAPASVTVALTLVSGDGRPHRAIIHTTPPRAVAVPAGGRAILSVPGQASGTVTILIDGGAGRGSIIFGSQPGP